MATGAESLGWFTRKWETQFCALLDYSCGPGETVEIMTMPYDGETRSHTPRLHRAVPLQYCTEADQSIGKYNMEHDTAELRISASGSAQSVRPELYWVCLQSLPSLAVDIPPAICKGACLTIL